MENESICRLDVDGKKIVLVGTAHVSQESVDLVEKTIDEEKPDTVCVELCQSRYDAVINKSQWQETDIFKIIREKRTLLLLSQLLMASIQKKIAERFNIMPGQEMFRAVSAAEKAGARIVMADRDIRTTLIRTWRSMRLFSKVRFFFEIVLSLFSADDITETDIEELKKHDALEIALQTFGKKMPEVKRILIDERDQYLAHHIAAAPGDTIVAVVGAGHVPGIQKHITHTIDLTALEALPRKGILGRSIGWGITAFVFAIIIGGFFRSGGEATISMLQWWIVANGTLSGIGSLIVLAHPATVLVSVVAAPLTSLNPMIAAGWVAGLTEAALRKPQVKDFIDLKDDISTVRGFWRNKITRILLVVIFVNIGSSVGTFVAIPLMMKYL